MYNYAGQSTLSNHIHTNKPKVLRSIGYRTLPVDTGVPYDEKKGVISNDQGRVLNGELYQLYKSETNSCCFLVHFLARVEQ